MGSGKRFSTFLVRFLVLFEGVSLALVVGLLYGVLSRTMTREFNSTVQAEQAEVSMVLQERFNHLETRLRELSLNNVVRVSLMLGVQGQLEEVLKEQFAPGGGALFLVENAETSAFVPSLPDALGPLRDYLQNARPLERVIRLRFADLGSVPLSVSSLPILRKSETLGYAHLVYDVTRDQQLWRRLKGGSLYRLLFFRDQGPVDLRDGTRLSPDQWPSFQELNRRKGESFQHLGDVTLIQMKEFPGLYFVASSTPLKDKKQTLILLLLGLCALVFLGTILVAVVIGRKVNEPLEDLADQALDVAKKPSNVFLQREKGRYTEFQKLADAFNQVLVFLLEAQEKLRKKARLELHASEDRYRKTFEAAPYSITITRQDNGRFLQVNEAFTHLSGYSREEAVDRTIRELNLIPRPEERERFVRIMQEQGWVTNHEIQYRTKDGRILDTLLSARPLVYDGQECLVAVVADITERKRAEAETRQLEQQLRHSQKMEAVGTLAGGIAHDFNNLLLAVQGYADLLLLKRKEGDAGWVELQEIARAAKRASELTQQLLTFSRKVESKLKPLDLNHEIEQVYKLLQRTIPKMIDIELDLQEELHTIYADAAQVEQAMMNLGLNARDAMPQGGTLRVETRNVRLTQENPCVSSDVEPGDYVRLSLMDTGCGMDREILEHIFEPFYTTKETGKGTGLGLAMVYGIVKNHGGAIRCESRPGEGTTFDIYFPVMEKHVQEEGRTEPPERLIGGNETILVVDDESTIQTLVSRVLTTAGYRVETAMSGEEAIRLYKGKTGVFDLVILDLIMPGMGGARCMEELLRLDPNVRVLLTSGYFKEDEPVADLKHKAKGFLPKPYDTREILREVRNALDDASLPDGPFSD
jgi:PAS domain S-box-containing protein